MCIAFDLLYSSHEFATLIISPPSMLILAKLLVMLQKFFFSLSFQSFLNTSILLMVLSLPYLSLCCIS